MVSTQFGGILKEFEKFFHCSLNPDNNDSCEILLKSGKTIQIELDKYGMIIAGCRLGVVHMGKYRNSLIKAALKSNHSSLSNGILGFSKKENQLILFIKLNPMTLTVHQIQTIMPLFVAKATLWSEAIAKGEVPESGMSQAASRATGIFGLIR